MKAVLGALFVAGTFAEYAIDSTWNVEKIIPKASAIGVSNDEVFVATQSGTPVHVFDKQSGAFKRSFGGEDLQKAHGIRIQRSADSGSPDTVWVTDMKAGKMVQFSLDGKKITSFSKGEGSGTGEFDAPADISFHNGIAYVSDGDMGKDNRVTAWKLGGEMLWQTKSEFNSPHSIEYHEQMDKLIVANRHAHNIHILDPATGNDEGILKCDALGLGSAYDPYSVRVIGATLLVLSNDGKKAHEFLHMVEFSSGMECGKVLQTISFNSKDCANNHLLGIDRDTEDVYVACLSGGGVKRYVKKTGHVVV